MIMTVTEYTRLVAMEYPAKTIDNIIVQMEARRKEIENAN